MSGGEMNILSVNGPMKRYAGSRTSVVEVAMIVAKHGIKTIILSSNRSSHLDGISNIFCGNSGNLSRVYLTSFSLKEIFDNWVSGFSYLFYLIRVERLIKKYKSGDCRAIVENNDIWSINQDILVVRSSFTYFYKSTRCKIIPFLAKRFLLSLFDFKSHLIMFVERSYFRNSRSKKIVVVSDFVKSNLLELYGKMSFDKRKLIVVYNGVNINIAKRELKRVRAFNDKNIVISFVGRNLLRKNILGLFEIMSKLSVNFKEKVLLRLIGNSEKEIGCFFEEHNCDFKQLKSIYNIEIIEPTEDIVDYFLSTHILLVPSIYDGFAKVVTEAMASGCCVVVSNGCGASEMIRNCKDGFVFDNFDYIRAAEIMCDLLNNPVLIDKCGSEARNAVLNGKVPSWDESAFKKVEIYRDVLEEKGELMS